MTLVGGVPAPLKNMTLSVGTMKLPTEWNKIHVPNHQPGHLLRVLCKKQILTILPTISVESCWTCEAGMADTHFS